MSVEDYPSSLDTILAIISELAKESTKGSYIFRGESKHYDKVSSSLYRLYEEIEVAEFDVETVQLEIIEEAKKYTNETDNFEILTELQHFGGRTNLIDFTTDFLTALYFACDGSPDKDGRVILLKETREKGDYSVQRPANPANRVIAQKSVFVQPSRGFVEPWVTIIIQNSIKQPMLDHLRRSHGISTETIYNDLLGFIRVQDQHESAYAQFYSGLTQHNRYNYERAIEHYNKSIALNPNVPSVYNNRGSAHICKGSIDNAIEDFKKAVSISPTFPDYYYNLGIAYLQKTCTEFAIQSFNQSLALDPDMTLASFGRGVSRLCLSEWSIARDDLKTAMENGLNVAAQFHEEFADISNFEEKNDVSLPKDIIGMLTK